MSHDHIGRIEIIGLLGVGMIIGGAAVAIAIDIASDASVFKDWQTLVAGMLALIAAAWTVREMRAQTAAEDARASRGAHAVFNVISARLRPLLELTNVAWKAIDETIAKEGYPLGSPQRAKTALDVYIKICRSAAFENFTRVADMRSGMSPDKQILLFEIEETFKEIAKDAAQIGSGEGIQYAPIVRIKMARIYLTYLSLAVDAFDPVLTKCFDGRERDQLNLSGDAELTQSTVDFIFSRAAMLDLVGNNDEAEDDDPFLQFPMSPPSSTKDDRT